MGNRKSKSEYEQLDQFGRHYLKVQHIDQASNKKNVDIFAQVPYDRQLNRFE